MKNAIMFFAALALTGGGCNNSSNNSEHFHAIDTNKLAKGAAYYQCEMHPDQISDSSGSCPVCGHDLTTAEKK